MDPATLIGFVISLVALLAFMILEGADPMSLLEFGSTREHNFLAWVDSSCQGSALAVVSLMHTGQVEVRLLRRGASTGDPPAPNQFGVFQLEKNDCDF